MSKYADDSNLLATASDQGNSSDMALSQFLEWSKREQNATLLNAKSLLLEKSVILLH